MKPEFKDYQKQVIKNAKALAKYLRGYDVDVLTGGTDNHLLLLDLRREGITGKQLQENLEKIGIISNKNAVPFDTADKDTTSGLRLGTAAVTSRDMTEGDMFTLATFIFNCIAYPDLNEEPCLKEQLQNQVLDLALKYPLYKKNGFEI